MPAERVVAALLENAEPGIRNKLSGNAADRLLDSLQRLSLLELVAFASSREMGEVSSFERSALEELAATRGFDSDHVREAWELVRTGKLGDDLAGVTAVSARTLRAMPGAVTDFVQDPRVVIEVIPALLDDLIDMPDNLGASIARDLREWFRGESPKFDEEHRERLLENTLREIYEVAPLGVVRSWSHEVTGYDSIKLAIILYASTHGVNLRDGDIEAVRTAVGGGDLAPLLVAAFEFFEREAPGKLNDFSS